MKAQKRKAALVAKKIQSEFPKTPEGRLMFSIIANALKDAVPASGKHNYRKPQALAMEARRYLTRDIPHAEICGVNSEYIHRVIDSIGLDISVDF